MNLLDRYIARQFLTNIIALFVILFSFIIVIDASLNLDEFHELAGKLGSTENNDAPGALRRALVTVVLVADFWWPKLLQLHNFLLGLIMVGAMGFTFSQMTRNREFVAMMAAGVSLRRVIRPVMIVALSLTVLQVINQEIILPKIAPLLVRDHSGAGEHELGVSSVPLTLDGMGRLFRAAEFNADTDTINGVYILERDADGRASRVITADSATYSDGTWIFVNGLAQLRSASYISPPEPIAQLESSLDPHELRINRFESYSQAMSFAQASQMLGRETLVDPKKRSRYQRIQWGRFAMISSGLLSLLISTPYYLTREPKNMVVQSIKCAPVAIIALVGGVLGASAIIPGIPAAIGVFIPVMILSVVAVAQTSSLKT
jgi:lipopolysaccharide export system permease protein